MPLGGLLSSRSGAFRSWLSGLQTEKNVDEAAGHGILLSLSCWEWFGSESSVPPAPVQVTVGVGRSARA